MMKHICKRGPALLALTLAACTGGHSEPQSQVVARVNDTEITVSQLRAALQAQGAEAATPQVIKQAVEALINEQLLLDAAVQNKLDRDPAVVQALEGARRQLLARAYIERMVVPKNEISAAAQADYYKKHPALFQQRKVYQLTAYTLPRSGIADEIRAQLLAARSTEKIEEILAARELPYEAQALTRAAEQLPLAELPKFTAARAGDLVMLEPQSGQLTMMLIGGVQESPITFERAQPIIQQYLLNVRNVEALHAHLRQARAASKIDYYGDSSESAADAGAAQLAATPPPDANQENGRLKQGAAVLN